VNPHCSDVEIATGWVFGDKMCEEASLCELTTRDVRRIDHFRALERLAAKKREDAQHLEETRRRYLDEAIF